MIPYFLKSHHTSKSHHPQNVAACFCQLVPIKAALKISLHDKGSTTIICVCAIVIVHAHYVLTIIRAVYMRACRSLHVVLVDFVLEI